MGVRPLRVTLVGRNETRPLLNGAAVQTSRSPRTPMHRVAGCGSHAGKGLPETFAMGETCRHSMWIGTALDASLTHSLRSPPTLAGGPSGNCDVVNWMGVSPHPDSNASIALHLAPPNQSTPLPSPSLFTLPSLSIDSFISLPFILITLCTLATSHVALLRLPPPPPWNIAIPPIGNGSPSGDVSELNDECETDNEATLAVV